MGLYYGISPRLRVGTRVALDDLLYGIADGGFNGFFDCLFQPFLVYMLVAGLYFMLCFPLSWWSRKLERRLLVAHRVEVAAA